MTPSACVALVRGQRRVRVQRYLGKFAALCLDCKIPKTLSDPAEVVFTQSVECGRVQLYHAHDVKSNTENTCVLQQKKSTAPFSAHSSAVDLCLCKPSLRARLALAPVHAACFYKTSPAASRYKPYMNHILFSMVQSK